MSRGSWGGEQGEGQGWLALQRMNQGAKPWKVQLEAAEVSGREDGAQRLVAGRVQLQGQVGNRLVGIRGWVDNEEE